jgi:predicted nucleotidyltransferase
MLKTLIACKTRRILLSTFFSNQEKEFYTRQLSALLGLSSGNIHREIKKLLTAGILTEHKVGNIKLFKLNKINPVYQELKNIIYKTEGIIKSLRDGFEKVNGIRVAFIYGSLAKGDERPDSDIDIFIIGDNLEENKLISSLSGLEKKLYREINYTWYSEEEYQKERKTNSFITEIIKNRKIFIKGQDHDL